MENRPQRSIGFVELLTLLFIALQLCGVIHWNWLWVLSPLWIPLAIASVVLIVAQIVDKAKDKAPKNRFRSGSTE